MSHMIYLNNNAAELNSRWESQCGPKLRSILVENGVGSLWDLVGCTKDDIRRMPGIGGSYMSQIEHDLETLGFSLRRDV